MTDLSDLTPRQIAVASMVAKAATPQQIAGALGISTSRVYVIIASIAFLIGTDHTKDERVQIALWWHERILPVRKTA